MVPRMATVVFALGNNPAVDAQDGLKIAELLGRSRNLAAVRAAKKIAARARLDTRRGEPENIELNDAEMIELFALLGRPSATPISAAMINLHHELAAALSRSDG